MTHNILQVKNLHVSVQDKEILKGVDLAIGTGETHVLMGPNGAGKSTLLNIIGLLDKPTTGTVTLLDTDCIKMSIVLPIFRQGVKLQ